jgi:hypothetical protein
MTSDFPSPTLPWSTADLADAIAAGLERAARRVDREQAVSGLDALDEVGLHPVLERALHRGGWGVAREQRYPAERRRRRESEGERCDFVLTPDRRPLVSTDAQATLFAPANAVLLEDAFWLEVKVVHQFLMEGANSGYSSQLLSTVRGDVTKLSKDPGILHAALLIVLFVRDAAVAHHDLRIWQDRCLERALPIKAPSIREVTITDRLGNGCCVCAVYGVAHY